MSVFGLPLGTFIALFFWIPFWWLIAGISLYRMNKHDREKRRAATRAARRQSIVRED